MEDVLDVYHAPYDPQFPLVCMDESNKQLVGEVHAPLAPAPGRGQINDHEYVRHGVAEIFPVGGTIVEPPPAGKSRIGRPRCGCSDCP